MRVIYVFFWHLANRVRLWMGRPARPKRCCRRQANLIFFQLRPDLSVGVCLVCGCRHFEAILDPGHIGITGAGI